MSFGILSAFQSVPVDTLHAPTQEYPIDIDISMAPSNTSPQWDSLDSELIMYDTTAEPDPAGHEVDMNAPETEELEMQESAPDDSAADQPATTDVLYDEELPVSVETGESEPQDDTADQPALPELLYDELPVQPEFEGSAPHDEDNVTSPVEVAYNAELPAQTEYKETLETNPNVEHPVHSPEHQPPGPDPPEDSQPPAIPLQPDPDGEDPHTAHPAPEAPQLTASPAPADVTTSPSVYSTDIPPVGDPHRLSLDEGDDTGLFIDPPPPVLLSLPSEPSLGIFSLFNDPSTDTSAPLDPYPKLLLADRPTLYYEPLPALFEALRQEPSFQDLFEQYELFISLPGLDLSISEDNISARNFTLHDLGVLHYWKLQGPLQIEVDASHLRFLNRYEALKAEIEQIQGAAAELDETAHASDQQEEPQNDSNAPPQDDAPEPAAVPSREAASESVTQMTPPAEAVANISDPSSGDKHLPEDATEETNNFDPATEVEGAGHQDSITDDYTHEYTEGREAWEQETGEDDPTSLEADEHSQDGEINYDDDEEDANEEENNSQYQAEAGPTTEDDGTVNNLSTAASNVAVDPEAISPRQLTGQPAGDDADDSNHITEFSEQDGNDPIDYGLDQTEDNLDVEQHSSQTVSSSSSPVIGRLAFSANEDEVHGVAGLAPPLESREKGQVETDHPEAAESDEVIAYEDSFEDNDARLPQGVTSDEIVTPQKAVSATAASTMSSKRSFSDFERDLLDDEASSLSEVQSESKRLKVS